MIKSQAPIPGEDNYVYVDGHFFDRVSTAPEQIIRSLGGGEIVSYVGLNGSPFGGNRLDLTNVPPQKEILSDYGIDPGHLPGSPADVSRVVYCPGLDLIMAETGIAFVFYSRHNRKRVSLRDVASETMDAMVANFIQVWGDKSSAS
jgi:hypothetical protein